MSGELDDSFARLVQRFGDRLADETVLDTLLECGGDEGRARAQLAAMASALRPTAGSHGSTTARKRVSGMLDGFVKRRRGAEASSPPGRPGPTPEPAAEAAPASCADPGPLAPGQRNALAEIMAAAPSQSAAGSPDRPRLMLLKPATVAAHVPCEFIAGVLPDDLAAALLRDMLAEALSWKPLPVVMFDKLLGSPHNTHTYVDRSRVGKQQFRYGVTSPDASDWLPSIRAAEAIVTAVVNERYGRRRRDPLEIRGRWRPDMIVANSYFGPSEHFGAHNDKLTYIGARPVIASLTLGASRTFRIRRLALPPDLPAPTEAASDAVSGSEAPQAPLASASTVPAEAAAAISAPPDGDAQARTFDILLPHNSLLIMFPPMQERYKHELPPVGSSLTRPTGTLVPHPISGETRINLTFRMTRPEVVAAIPKCSCGAPCEMRVVIKQRETLGRYFWQCRGDKAGGKSDGQPAERDTSGGRPAGDLRCGFFQWASFGQ
ncbi:hypothetical protein HK105_205555 [Polyrhizophydium stewartii]|uniref:Fe2OG dioxygenase domain-containing protein n=1 Tax=Polyrhizophydium stewartii TaxID=2732419 RepID=A0ABR4N644_9FUNG